VYEKKKKPIQEHDNQIEISYNDDDQRFYVTKSGRTTKPNPIYSFAASVITGDPDSLQQARMSNDAEQWNAEIDREFKSLWDGGTFEKIDNVPEGHKPVKSKFTFKRVLNPDGSLKKHRVRVVVRGDQQPWETFNETFAGTAHRKSVMLLLSLAAQEKMEICTADVKSAFLIPTLEEEIYMELPTSYTGKNNKQIVRLRKALYGLKQAANAFMNHLRSSLQKLGFRQQHSDACIYVKGNGIDQIIVATHVDDLLILSKNTSLIEQFMQELSNVYEITTSMNPTSYLGMQLERNSLEGTVKLSLPAYSQRVTDQFLKNKDGKSASTPTIANPTSDIQESTALNKDEQQIFMQLVGSLLYLSICTRPDILSAMHPLTQKMQKANQSDLKAAYRVLRYIKSTIHMGITFFSHGDTTIYAYADAAFGTTTDRKSQHGLCYTLGRYNSAFYSTVKRQAIVALSSTEAEYVAASEATREIIWIRTFMDYLGYSQANSTVLFQDNESCIKVASKPDINDRSKHIDIKYHFVRDHLQKGTISMEHLPSSMMTADILTKPLTLDKFVFLRYLLMGEN
jgi:hypothetical protein